MFLRSVRLEGFRGLSCTVDLTSPLSVVVGENNSGKSAVVDALRSILWPADGPQGRRWIRIEDFSHGADGKRATDQFEIDVVFEDLTPADEASLVTCLSPSLEDGMARLRLRASVDRRGRVDQQFIGGDAETPQVDRFAREAVEYVYLPPLRDAARDLAPGRGNRVATLLRALAPEGDDDRTEMERIVGAANRELEQVRSMRDAERSIEHHLLAMVSDHYALPTDLRFAPAEFEAIVRTLRGHIGEIAELPLESTGLGMHNLLFMAVLLSSLRVGSESRLTVLLVEEPEAHLHPQIQDLLMRFLEAPDRALANIVEGRRGGGSVATPSESGEQQTRVQSIVTSHSPNFAAAAGAERMTVMARANLRLIARSPARFGLEARDLDHLRRYLDVTKAALLFARGVILVEGIAEQLVLPAIARRIDLPLHEFGVTVVNVEGLAFGPFVELFGSDRLPQRCALVTDGDAREGLDGEDLTLSASTMALKERVASWANVDVFNGMTTFESELAEAGEWSVLMDALKKVHRRRATELSESPPPDPAARGAALLDVLERNRSKGRFAQALAKVLDDGATLTPPRYIADSIRFACRT